MHVCSLFSIYLIDIPPIDQNMLELNSKTVLISGRPSFCRMETKREELANGSEHCGQEYPEF